MPWVRLDDQFPLQRQVRALSSHAFRVHVSGLCWCSAQLTDGRIRAAELRQVADVPNPTRYAAELVAAGLWRVAADGDGWQIVHGLEHQPTADEVRAKRTAHAARQARWRAARDASGDASTDTSRKPKRRSAKQDQNAASGEHSRRDGRVNGSVTDASDTSSEQDQRRSADCVDASPDASRDATPVPRPDPVGVGSGRGIDLPVGQRARERCALHMQELPCRGCAADAKADDPDAPLRVAVSVLDELPQAEQTSLVAAARDELRAGGEPEPSMQAAVLLAARRLAERDELARRRRTRDGTQR